MNAIRIENLRSLTDTGFVDLKPLTLLVGQNSSGKSSFLRFFPLLRQSFEDRGAEPLSWYGRFVDFGSFQEAVGRKSGKEDITLHFCINLQKSLQYPPFDHFDKEKLLCTLKISSDKTQEKTFLKTCLISCADHKIRIEFDSKQRVTSFRINKFEWLNAVNEEDFVWAKGHVLPLPDMTHDAGELLESDIESEIKKHIHHSANEVEIHLSIRSALDDFIRMKSSEAILEDLKAFPSWKPHVYKWTTDSNDFKALQDRMIASDIIFFYGILDDYLHRLSVDIRYIAPMRATAKRYYRVQNLILDEVDSQGQNLAMFMKNLTSSDREEFENWTIKHFDFILRANFSGGHISLNMNDTSEEEFNLADTGFGYSQIFPVLLQLWFLISKKQSSGRGIFFGIMPGVYMRSPLIFAIEQPELHLHPGLQAKLADVFIAAVELARENKIDLRLIIETHSEVIINRIGHRIANKELNSKDVNVVLFEKEPAALSTKVSFSDYDEDGFLTNWPIGFLEPDII